MYDEREIEDSLEFVKQIELYEKCRDNNIVDVMGLRDAIRSDSIITDNYFKDVACGQHDMNADDVHYPEGGDSGEDMPQRTKGKSDDARWNIADFAFIAACVVISVMLSYVFTHYIAHHTKVEGSSMNETLSNGDYLIVEKVSYYIHDPERFDIVVFPYSKDVNYIKRIIGMPGEKLQIIDGKVYINDRRLEDDIYGKELIEDPGVAAAPIYLSDDEYFVMGDNRNSSIDSRSDSVGAVKKERIEGKAMYRIWPFSEFGSIGH